MAGLKQIAQNISWGKNGTNVGFHRIHAKNLRVHFKLSSQVWISGYMSPLQYGSLEEGRKEETLSTRSARPQRLQATITHLAELPSSVDIRLPDQ